MGLLSRSGQPRAARAADAGFTCDIAYFGEDGVPAEQLVAAQVAQVESAAVKTLLLDGYDRIRADYAAGGFPAHPAAVLEHLRQAAAGAGVVLAANNGAPLMRFFDRVNRVLFIHQTLEWLLDAGFTLRLHGGGWERHPRLRGYAAGPAADAQAAQAPNGGARIQLAMGPYGAVTPRVLDHVAAGAFYLFRFCPADVIERIYPPLQAFCLRQGITTNLDLRGRATPAVRKLLGFAETTLGIDVLAQWPDFVPHLLNVAATGRARSAAALWSSYPAVSFGSRDELIALCSRYLFDAAARARLADEMQRELAERLERVRVTVNRSAAPAAKPAAA